MIEYWHILPLLPIGFFWIQWVQFAILPGNILGFISAFENRAMNILKSNQAKKLFVFCVKPLWGCGGCMASVHGTFIFWLHGSNGVVTWIMFCISLSGLLFTYNEILNHIDNAEA